MKVLLNVMNIGCICQYAKTFARKSIQDLPEFGYHLEYTVSIDIFWTSQQPFQNHLIWNKIYWLERPKWS